MTAANVRFLTIEGALCSPDQKPARFTFDCVGHNRSKDPRLPKTPCAMLLIAEGPHSAAHGIKRDGQGKNGGCPQWGWDGNRENPTFTPSINCESHCGWHGYLERSRCVSTAKVDEP